MSQFLEAIGIALSAIWSNKLRSFLTVLGNVVAVTSIIAVVSLIQGMNGYVTDAIVTDVGADNFTIQRNPVVRTREDEDRVRSNPKVYVMHNADDVLTDPASLDALRIAIGDRMIVYPTGGHLGNLWFQPNRDAIVAVLRAAPRASERNR